MRYKRDTRKKRFLDALTEQGTVYHAAQAAGVSRMTAYRWRQDDREFASQWDEAMETAVDAVESALYQKAKGGDTVPMIFYLKAHRPIYRDRLNIDLRQLHAEVEEGFALVRQRLPPNRRAEFTMKDLLKISLAGGGTTST